jgi:prepilin-type N-terminal cleavage/methylation domain-containing protein/prepilin-type processing-associated H-X9-DG protein
VRQNSGFTLIELIAVMAIIAVLLGLLVPAITGARETSRRIQCVNNLKQISLALQGYLCSHNAFPCGSYNETGPVLSVPEGYQVSWIVSILPHLEQSGTFRTFDFHYGATDPANQTVRFTPISTLRCPVGGGAGSNFFTTGAGAIAPTTVAARTNYAGCHNDTEAPIDVDNHGMLYLNSRVGVVDVPDGLSQTILVGEIPVGSPLGWVSGTRATLRNAGHPINRVNLQVLEYTSPPSAPLPEDVTLEALERGIEAGALAVSPRFVGGFGSAHLGGGANVALGDGSVRFLKQTIDQAVYQRLAHRADGEPIDGESY